MANKEEFKNFVRKNPTLVNYVNNNEMTWQKFYEMYDMYGEANDVWKNYTDDVRAAQNGAGVLGAADLMKWFKNIDLDSVQNGVTSLQKMVGMIQEFGTKNNTKKEEYKPRPLYKHFDD